MAAIFNLFHLVAHTDRFNCVFIGMILREGREGKMEGGKEENSRIELVQLQYNELLK